MSKRSLDSSFGWETNKRGEKKKKQSTEFLHFAFFFQQHAFKGRSNVVQTQCGGKKTFLKSYLDQQLQLSLIQQKHLTLSALRHLKEEEKTNIFDAMLKNSMQCFSFNSCDLWITTWCKARPVSIKIHTNEIYNQSNLNVQGHYGATLSKTLSYRSSSVWIN